jgi:arylsulfatase A
VVQTKISKRTFLKAAAAAALVPVVSSKPQSLSPQLNSPPNIVLIYMDDLGYGDLNCYGSKMATLHINQMAQEGVRFLQFTSAAPVCSPSRAALLTGRYPARTGVPGVLQPADNTGLPRSEVTIASMLKAQGYKTMCIGKWHLGSQAPHLPTDHGFDEFFGLLYSHDMSPLPLMHNNEVIEDPVDLATLTPRYNEQAVQFIANAGSSPFFLYFAHFLPHIPLVSSKDYEGTSAFGPYGDAISEIDGTVGQILGALKDNGLDQNTLVMLSSDHGPWHQGSTANLKKRKGDTFEGGVRVPFIASFPGQIPKGSISTGLASNMDIVPTLARLCNAPLPGNAIDGTDIWPLITGEADDIDRDVLLYFDGWYLQCARLGRWKLHLTRYNAAAWGPAPPEGFLNLPLPKPELYNLETDPGENFDVADRNPEIVAAIRARVETMLADFPQPVRDGWRFVQSLKVENTPSGALPVLKKSKS